MKLNRWENSTRDCGCALRETVHLPLNQSLNIRFKAFYRQAKAYQELGQYTDAIKNLDSAIKLEHNNIANNNEAKEMRQMLLKKLPTNH